KKASRFWSNASASKATRSASAVRRFSRKRSGRRAEIDKVESRPARKRRIAQPQRRLSSASSCKRRCGAVERAVGSNRRAGQQVSGGFVRRQMDRGSSRTAIENGPDAKRQTTRNCLRMDCCAPSLPRQSAEDL